jgi:hypothetical protein
VVAAGDGRAESVREPFRPGETGAGPRT